MVDRLGGVLGCNNDIGDAHMNLELNRRAAIGLGLGMGAASIAANTASAAGPPSAAVSASGRHGTRKLIIRADDIGQSVVCNIGSFEALEHGVSTAADVMLDSPGTEDALKRLRRLPWISVGWHMHMWGAPVLGARKVPSLVEHGGQFDGRFRTDLATATNVDPDEAVRELRAQLVRCRRILGRLPDTAGNARSTTIWGTAVRQVLDEFRLPYNFSTNEPTNAAYVQKIRDAQAAGEAWAQYYSAQPSPRQPADPQWIDRKIVNPAGTTAFVDLLTDSISEVEEKYDPVLFYTEDRSGILDYPKDVVTWQAWHPGYVDYYVYRLGERYPRPRAQQFVVGRTQDVAAMTDPRLRTWLKANDIELVNFRDALYGSNDYQRHLRAIHSDLAIRSRDRH
jgi:predicted glycoside hydrolase/deacetylase ChbG (UPF0249 family)